MDADDFFNLSKPLVKKVLPSGSGNRNPLLVPTVYKVEEKPLLGVKYAEKFKVEQIKNLSLALQTKSHSSIADSRTNMDIVSAFGESTSTLANKPETIYCHYNFKLPKSANKKLTILDHRDKIIEAINSNPVVVLQGETGCGKSTQIPQMILDDCYNRSASCNIIVTQPRRIAAISIAKKVAAERECSVGSLIGYQIALDTCISEDTRILYCTTGVLLQKIIQLKRLTNFTHIVLDEVHERSEEMDFLLIVIRMLLSSNSSNVKIILMSATIETQKFADYFMIDEIPSPIITIDSANIYSVSTYYLDDLRKIMEHPNINYPEPGISDEMYDLAAKLCDICNLIDEREKIKFDREMNTDIFVRGAILIFLPGVHEIEMMLKAITKQQQISKISYDIKILHSCIANAEQQTVHQKSSDNQRKVILATNIAESSLTIVDVKYIIDFCLTKSLQLDRKTNFTMLCLEWASKSNCKQRAGRCGRVMNGRVYRLVHQNFFNHQMLESNTCELLRCPLENAILKSKVLDMGPPNQILGLAMDPPDLSDIKKTILILKESGALLKSHNNSYDELDGDLTYIGYVMASLPLQISFSKLIVLGYMFSVLDETIIIAAGLSGKNVFPISYSNKFDSYSLKLKWANGSGSDCITILNAYSEWSILREQRKIFNEDNWAQRYGVDLRSLREMHLLILEIRRRLNEAGLNYSNYRSVHWTKTELPFILNIVIAGAFYPNYFIYTKTHDQDAETIFSEINGRNPCTTVYLKGFQADYIGPLYTSALRKYFKRCVTSENNLKFSFPKSSGKIFLTFTNTEEFLDESLSESNSLMPGFVTTEIYKALKLGRLNKYIQLFVANQSVAMKYAESKNFGMIRNGVWIRNNKTYENLHLYAIPSQMQKVIEGTLAKVVHCNKFYIQLCNATYEKVRAKLNEPDALDQYKSVSDIQVGDIVAVKYKNVYCRGKINSIQMRNKVMEIRIELLDFAIFVVKTFDQIRKLNESLLTLCDIPPQVLECTLTEIHPVPMKSKRGHWTKEVVNTFINKCKDKKLIAQVFSVVECVCSVILFDGNENINELLVREGYAINVNENYLSMYDHNRRSAVQIANERDPSHYDIEQYLQSCEYDDEDIEPPPINICDIKIKLTGPYSPLLTEVFSIFRSTYSKKVSIDKNSVNSILLDSNPYDNSEKMIVASSVANSSTSDNIILRQTTLMPNVHGFAPIMAMLFAPSAELRRSADKTRYAGVLTGLGCNSKGESLFEEHDLCFNFDAEFTEDDWHKINHLRFIINQFVYTPPGENIPNLSDEKKFEIKTFLKREIISLFGKQRKSVPPECPTNEYSWKSQKEEDIIHLKEMYLNKIFPFHTAEKLQKFDDVKKKELHDHCNSLYSFLKTGLYKFGDQEKHQLRCELCNQNFSVLIQLRIHMASQGHRQREVDIDYKSPATF